MSSTTPYVSESTATRQQRLMAAQAGLRLGERLRQLRVAAGMTQTGLAGDRFSKEYVSQIERGKTRPTAETILWLADRLGVDAGFLANGVSADERGRVDAALARCDALVEARRNDEALEEFDRIRSAVLSTGLPELEVRALCGEAIIRLRRSEVRDGIALLERARALTESNAFSDVERADVLFRLGIGRFMLNSVQTAIALFDEALKVAERSQIPSDQLRSNILSWRSRCYRRRRDFEAAREDVERALELAESLNDTRTTADVYFQASIIADREGRWVLARSYAERAKSAYEELADRSNLGRLLNNLGGINFLLGHPEEALALLKDAVRIALEIGNDAEAAHAVNGIAQVHLRTGEGTLAEEQARYALQLLGDRVDEMHEIGNAQLVLGRALLEQNRLEEAEEAFKAGEAAYDQMSSGSHRADAWLAQGDLAARRGDDRMAAKLYRQAADALQDVRF
ncbi:MAG: tetratricopeptide repeat protein [Actinobacteria bacterium]|nr:MAG: tetratricopeptide repeat protein [Actinomycetota bacterium]